MNKDDYKLCYVDENKAWFTDNFERQTGDEWNDVPYEHNAEEPYTHYFKDGEEYPIDLVACYFEISEYGYLPCDGYLNSPYSVESINKGAVAWINAQKYSGEYLIVQAGTTFKDFKKKIKEFGGSIYVEEE